VRLALLFDRGTPADEQLRHAGADFQQYRLQRFIA